MRRRRDSLTTYRLLAAAAAGAVGFAGLSQAQSTGGAASPQATTLGTLGDGVPDYLYNPLNGDLIFRKDGVNISGSSRVAALQVQSASSQLIPQNSNFNGIVDVNTPASLSGANFSDSGYPDSFDVGRVLPAGLSSSQLTSDLTLSYLLFGGGGLRPADLIPLQLLKWTGAASGNWDTGSINWALGTSGVAYSNNVAVAFGDTNPITAATISNTNVTIQAGGVQPAAVSFSNSAAVNYTLNSADAVGIAGPADISKDNSGNVTLQGANSFTGSVAVFGGTLTLAHNAALGASSGVTISSGAALQLQGNITTSAAVPLALNGSGIGGAGALNNVSGTNTYTGPVTLNTSSTIGAAADTLNLTGALVVGGTSAVTLTKAGAGTLTLAGSSAAGVTLPAVTVNAGTLNFGGAAGLAGPVTISGALTINNGATAKLTPTASNANRITNNFVTQLSIGTNGLLDLGNHFLRVDNTATPESALRQYLHNGYNADPVSGIGDWNGRGGITSSDAIKSHNGASPDFRISVGYVNGIYALDPLINGPIPGQETLPTNRTLIRPALYGDLNLDGKVDDTDLAIFSGLGQYNQPTDKFGWLGGDLNQDGKVDDTDLQIFSGAGNYNGPAYGAPGAAGSSSATPSLTGHAAANGDIVLSSSTSAGVPGDGVLDFVYDPSTGHLTLSYDGDPRVTSAQPFQVVRFKSAGGHFVPANFNQTAFGAGVTATTAALNGTASGSNSVPDGYDMGAVLPTGLTVSDLTSDLTLQWNVFGGGLTLKNGDVVVPEPATLTAIGAMSAFTLLSRRRRRRRLRGASLPTVAEL